MKIKRITGKLILVGTCLALTATSGVSAQVVEKGLSPASNTYRSFQNASLARDSGLNQPLDLLNDFYPAITVTIEDHDNVRRRPGVQEEDLVVVAQPSLGYRTNIGRHKFYASYSGTYTFHQDLEQEDAESNVFSANLGLDLTRRWDLDLFASYGDSFEQRGISGGRNFDQFINNGVDSGPEEVEFLNYGADLVFGRKIGTLTGVLGFEHSETGFESSDLFNGADAADRDRESDSVHFDLNWRFASKTSVFGRIQSTDTDYDVREPNLDNDQVDYLIGLRFKPASALSGVVSVGRSDRDFDDAAREDFDGSIYYANLNYTINPFSTIGLSASRFIEEPGDEDSSFYESQFFGVSWDHALTPRVLLNAYVKWIEDDYDIDREDEFVDWGLGVDYVWRNWLTAGLYYGEIERESTLESVEYDDRFIGIRLSSDLRSLLEGRGRKRVEPSSYDYPRKTRTTQ